MAEMSLNQYLRQIDHACEEMREPENPERDQEINAIQKKVRDYLLGLERVDTIQMQRCVIAGIEEIAPRVEALVKNAIHVRDTWPAPAPEHTNQ